MDGVPRLRMFAGPNGSGKTTVKNGLQRSAEWFGTYINSDDIEKGIKECGALSLESFGVTTTADEIREFFAASTFLRSRGLNEAASALEFRSGAVGFGQLPMNSYYASVLADFLRRKKMAALESFTFETVMSAADKIELLSEARGRGYRTYLYYVATESPTVNVQRVRQRAGSGGHDVPEEKIISRYHRSLALLPGAIRRTDRAFMFDTSGDIPLYFAEIIGGKDIKLKLAQIPIWFQPVWDQF